jgi:hypothetical protein
VRLAIAITGLTVLAASAWIAAARPLVRQDQAKPTYQATGSEATITGKISFEGKPPQPKLIDTSADPACGANELYTEDFIIRGNLANVFVYIRSGEALEWYSFEVKSAEVSLAHNGCRYTPHVLGMQTSQTLKIFNEDATAHNIHFMPKANPESNQSQPPGAKPIELKFKTPEVGIPVRCNQHPWEKAYVAVLSHPFFAVTGFNGSYKISGLPSGHYTVTAWHEKLGEQTVEVTIGVKEQKKLDFSFSLPENQ